MEAINKRQHSNIELQANLHGAKLNKPSQSTEKTSMSKEQQKLLEKAIQGRIRNG